MYQYHFSFLKNLGILFQYNGRGHIEVKERFKNEMIDNFQKSEE